MADAAHGRQETTSRFLVMLASTFPRWDDDTVPPFVLHYAQHVLPFVKGIAVVAPHYKGAKGKDQFGEIEVRRFKYAYPYKYENIAYGQFKKTKFYPVKVLLYTLSEFWTTLLVSLRTRPAVINAHWLIPQGFVAVMAAPLVGAKVVISVHGSDVFTLNGKYMRKVKRFILQRADVVVANSSATQVVCKELWAGKEYPIIPMGIDAAKFEQVQRTAGKGYRVLFVGRLAPNKGVIYLCQAIKLLHETHKDVHLDIVGEGPERAVIERYIDEHNLGKVISLVGWVQPGELLDWYAKADVFAGPSIEIENGASEALGLVFAEASAAGLPVVSTNVGGIKDVVKHGETGLLVPQKDPQALCGALEDLYLHRKKGEEMGRHGREFVRANFSWESVTKQYVELFDELLA